MIFRGGTSPERNAGSGTPAPVASHIASAAKTKAATRSTIRGWRNVSQVRAKKFGGRLRWDAREGRWRRGETKDMVDGEILKNQRTKEPTGRTKVLGSSV